MRGRVGAGIVAAIVVFACFAAVRRLRTTREGADFRLVIADGQLRMYEPGRRGRQLVEVDLNCVRHIHWYVSTSSRNGTVRVTLWGRESTFTLPAIDVHPDDPEARELGWFRGPDVVTSAPDKLRVANRHRGPTETRRRRPRSNTNGNTQAEIAALYATSAPVVMKTV